MNSVGEWQVILTITEPNEESASYVAKRLWDEYLPDPAVTVEVRRVS